LLAHVRGSLTGLGQDLRLAARAFRCQPGFTVTAVLILALGLGATTAMFSVTNTLTLVPLPYPAPERLVRFYRVVERARGFPSPHSQSAFEDYRRMGTAFEDMTAYVPTSVNVITRPGETGKRVSALQVTASYFSVHGLSPLLGRGFSPGEDRRGSAPTVVLSWRLWQDAFGGDPAVIGRSIRLEEDAYTVVGVMPRAFNDLRRFWARVELWYPLKLGPPAAGDRDNHRLQIVARLKQGQSVAAGQSQMDALTTQLNAQHGSRGGVHVLPLAETGVNTADSRATQLSLWLALVVLLVACFNLAGLQLARLASRHREHALRMALGAGRGRLIRQLLAESFLVCAVGGFLGVLLAAWICEAISARLVLFGRPAGLTIGVDFRVLAFASSMVVGTTLAVGLLPAWLASRADLAHSIRSGGRGATDRSQPRLRHGLVVAEMALALVLLAAGGLFVRGLDRFLHGGQGWNVDSLLAGDLAAPRGMDNDPGARLAFLERAEARIANLPGIESASLSSTLPVSIFSFSQPFVVEGRPDPLPGQAPVRYMDVVSPGYFRTLGIPVERGRGFLPADGPDAEPVVIINRAMAETLWPGQDPLGRRIAAAVGERRWRTIVGVVSDVRVATELREPITRFRTYHPLRQNPGPRMTLAARIRTSPQTAVAEIRQALATLDPSAPPFDGRPVRESVDLSMANLTLLAWMLFGFALLGLVLAALGIYGLFAAFVVQRTREIGVRVALGAQRAQVIWLVLGKGLRLALAGAAIGLLGSVVVIRVLTATASELPASDPLAIAVLTAALLAVGTFACWLPARRAASLEPMQALRSD
jgi:putative ABC transport system permease protein